MKKVTVLGCGPAGLLAAHAFASEGWNVKILSKKQPSRIGGAQYLHRFIPGLTNEEPDGEVTYLKVGTRDGYAEKVYGSAGANVSWDLYDDGQYDIWSLRRLYDHLWTQFEPFIEHAALDPDVVRLVSEEGLVVSSIPAKALCTGSHTFKYQPVWIIQQQRGIGGIPENLIVYNGLPETQHYRYSRIFGVEGWEFSNPSASEYDKAVNVKKPISTDCNCQPSIIRVGRYGKWEKSQLTHHAYEEALEVARAL